MRGVSYVCLTGNRYPSNIPVDKNFPVGYPIGGPPLPNERLLSVRIAI